MNLTEFDDVKIHNNGVKILNYKDVIRLYNYNESTKQEIEGYGYNYIETRVIGSLLSNLAVYSNDATKSNTYKLAIATAVLNNIGNTNNFDKCEALSFLLKYDNNTANYPMYCQKILDLNCVEHINNVYLLRNSNFNKYIQTSTQLEHVQKIQKFYSDYISKQIDNMCDYDKLQIESSFGTAFMKNLFDEDTHLATIVSSNIDKLITDYPFISPDARNKLMYKCLCKLSSDTKMVSVAEHIAHHFIPSNTFKYDQTVLKKCKQILEREENQNTNHELNNQYNLFNEMSDDFQQTFTSQTKQQQIRTVKRE